MTKVTTLICINVDDINYLLCPVIQSTNPNYGIEFIPIQAYRMMIELVGPHR
jgi:hypothetical protein